MKFFLLFIFFCLLNFCCLAQNGRQILINASSSYDIRNYGYYYEDSTLKANIDSLVALKKLGRLSKLTPYQTFNKGFSNSYWWIVFDVENTMPETVNLFFNERSNSVNRLQLFKLDSAGKITPMALTGDHFKFSSRPVNFHNYLYPIKLKAHEKATYFLWADKRGQNMVMPIGLAKDVDLIHAELSFYAFIGACVGLFVFVVIFNVFLFISIRDKIHLYYALYALSVMIFNLEDEGLAFQWLYPNVPVLQDYLRHILAFLTSALLVQVMQLFVNQTKNNSKFYVLANGYKICCYALILLPVSMLFKTSLFLEKISFFAANFIALLTIVILIICTIERIIKGYKLAWYYLVAVLILLCGILVYVLNTLGITTIYFPHTTVLSVGLTIEVAFLTFALTQRYNFLKKETKKLQHEKSKLEVALVDDVFEAQENERARLARDLHDDLGGTLSAIKLNLTSFKTNVGNLSPQNQVFYAQTVNMIEKACLNLREISHDLMPKDLAKLGLIDALKEQFIFLEHNSTVCYKFIYDLQTPINRDFELAIYRILKELINNIEKHSLAVKATIQILSANDGITLMCEDNGVGFNSNNQHFGLGINNISSRVNYLKGKLHIDTNKNGTTITVQIPNINYD